MDIGVLKSELTDDPLSRGYSAMTAVEAAVSLNAGNRTKPKSSLNGNDLFVATDATEFAGLTDQKRLLWVSWCNADRDPFNAANVEFLAFIFGTSSTTIGSLQALRLEACSRAVELGLGFLYPGHIENARM